MRDITENLSKDIAKKIASFLVGRHNFFAFSSVNKKLHRYFQEDRQKILNQGQIIQSGQGSSFFLTIEGDAYAAGKNFYGVLGLVRDRSSYNAWMKTGPPGKKVMRIFSRFENTVAFCSDGVYGCGNNMHGQLGLGNNGVGSPWVKIGPAGKRVSEVKLGPNKIFVCCEDGWYGCGRNFRGEFGTGDREDRWDWVKIQVPGKIVLQLIQEDIHTFIRCDDGWYACGSRMIPCRINPVSEPVLEWIKIGPPGKTVFSLVSNKGFTTYETIFVRCGDGWYAKGDNQCGQLGMGDTKAVLDWIKIGPLGKNILELQTCGYSGDSTFIRCEDGWYGCGEDPTVNYDYNRRGRFRLYWTKIKLPGKEIFELQARNLQDIFVRCQDGWYSRGSNWGGRLGTGDVYNNEVLDWIKIGPEGKKFIESLLVVEPLFFVKMAGMPVALIVKAN